MDRRRARTAVFLGYVAVLTVFWLERGIGFSIIVDPGEYLLPWAGAVLLAAAWHFLLSRRLEGRGRLGGSALPVVVRVGAALCGVVAAGRFVDTEYGWWFAMSDGQKGMEDVQIYLEDILLYASNRFLLVYFGVGAVVLALVAVGSARGRGRRGESVPWWRDVALLVAVGLFCGVLPFFYLDHYFFTYLLNTPVLEWAPFVLLLLALGFAAIGGAGAGEVGPGVPAPPQPTALGLDIAVFSVPVVIAFSYEEYNTFAPGVPPGIVLAVTVLGIVLCQVLRDRKGDAAPKGEVRGGARV